MLSLRYNAARGVSITPETPPTGRYRGATVAPSPIILAMIRQKVQAAIPRVHSGRVISGDPCLKSTS